MTDGKPPTLAGKLVKVMEAVSHIAKTGRNTAQNYDFVTDADVSDALRKALIAQGVAVVTSVTEIESVPFRTANDKPQFLVTVKGDITFIDRDSDQSLTADGVGQGADSADKGVYKAITGMVKYALLKTFLIPTGDDPEGDEKPERGGTGNGGASGDAASSPSRAGDPNAPLTDAQRRKLFAAFKAAGIEENEWRQAFTLASTGKHSSKQLNSADLDKIIANLKDGDKVIASQPDREGVEA